MYFHKDVGNLTLAEAALLAGMIQSPNPYNPYRHPKRATERRNQVLRAMSEAGFIDAAAAEAASPQPLRVESAVARQRGGARTSSTWSSRSSTQRYDAKDLTTQNLVDLHVARPAAAGPRAGRRSRDGPRARSTR